ncbi:MAG: TatD family hydrolase [Arcticibacter sp.]
MRLIPLKALHLTDTHIHLYAEEFDCDLNQLIADAKAVGVSRMLLPNIDLNSIDGMFKLVDEHPGLCYPMVGLHPCYVKEDYREQLSVLKEQLITNRHRVIAVGEIGLDFYWDLTFRKQQEEAFLIQLEWAEQHRLPISIHSRESTAELLDLLRGYGEGKVKGVFHCFSGNIEQAHEAIRLGFLLGIGGVVTFKKASLAEIVAAIPMEHLILETDGPYLAPTPHRGKRNEPAYLRLVAEKVAELKSISDEEVANVTSANADRLFHL